MKVDTIQEIAKKIGKAAQKPGYYGSGSGSGSEGKASSRLLGAFLKGLTKKK